MVTISFIFSNQQWLHKSRSCKADIQSLTILGSLLSLNFSYRAHLLLFHIDHSGFCCSPTIYFEAMPSAFPQGQSFLSVLTCHLPFLFHSLLLLYLDFQLITHNLAVVFFSTSFIQILISTNCKYFRQRRLYFSHITHSCSA